MYKKIFVGGAAAAVALSSAGLAMAAGGQGDGQRAAGDSHARAASTLTACDGGVQKRVYNRINSSPFTFTEGSAPFLPGAAVVVVGPRIGKDTLSIAFSAETQLDGSTPGDNLYDWMGLEVLVDGVPIQPYTSSPDVLSITGANTYDSNAAQFCTKIGRGKHRIQVRTNLVDGKTANNLKGWFDDYTLHVEQSE